jgi:hypothetical protein
MRINGGVACLLLGAAVLCSAVSDGTAEIQKQEGPTLYSLDHMDVSPPLRDIKPVPHDPLKDHAYPAKRLPLRHAPPLAPFKDPALQETAPGPVIGVTNGINLDAVGVPMISDCCIPPDTEGSVGDTQYVQWVNIDFAVFNKSTGALVLGPVSGNTLWSGFGGACETDNDGDPIVNYDKAANRWVMTQFAVATGPPFFQCIAVSTTSDATGSFRRFAFSFPNFNDYPKVGVWPDAYYFTFNMFNPAGTVFLGAEVCAVDRNQMITPAGTPAAAQCFGPASIPQGGLLPADLDGSTPPPAGSPNYIVAFDGNGISLDLWKFHIDFVTPANTTLTGPNNFAVTPFTPACLGGTCIPQPATPQALDSLADRLMWRLAYRNFGGHESLVVNHSVDIGTGVSGIRWYEIRSPGAATPTVFQQSTFAPADGTYRWMGSIAMDKVGNMLLGYSASSSSVRPSVRITGRFATDTLNTMEAENEVKTGAGSQVANRWGDYSAMSIDPTDDCTFFYTQEYLQTDGVFNWSTRLASFKFPNCPAAVPSGFFPLTPCRVADTRNPAGPSGGPHLIANTSRNFPAAGICGIPPTAKAIAINVTVVNESNLGDLRLFPAGGSVPGASTINFAVNKVRANNAILSLGTGGQIAVQCDMASGSTDFLFDVTGFFQ